MKLQHSLLSASLLAILASPTAFASGDGGNGEGDPLAGAKLGDTQTAIITIPEVSMIDVTNEITVALKPPTDAGDNFETVSFGEKAIYDISANIPASEPEAVKKIVASSKVPAGWKFGIALEAPKASGKSTDMQYLTQTTSDVTLVTDIQNVAQKSLGMKIEVGPVEEHIMPSHTEGQAMKVDIVYTITAG